VADTLGEHPSKLLLRDVHKETLQQLSGCVQAIIDGADKMEGFADARKVLDSKEAHIALGEDTLHALTNPFNDKAVAAVVAAAQPSMKAGKWEDAFGLVKKWADAGSMAAQQVEVASGQLRDQITKYVLAKSDAVLGQAKPEPMLAEVERALKLFEGLNVAPELKIMQSHLTTWIECKKLSCTAAVPKMQYSCGATPLLPSTQPTATTGDMLPNATQLWVLAAGKGKSLVAKEEPADVKTWYARLSAAKGWVDTSVLQPTDTSLWLPVGKALEGVRVWLPTGRDDKLYLLGTAEKADGNDITVKKISDGQSVTVKRDVLRTGNMIKGLKVMAFCSEALAQVPARFEEMVPITQGQTMARVMCFDDKGKDDKTKDVVFGSLRSKVEWLPPRKP